MQLKINLNKWFLIVGVIVVIASLSGYFVYNKMTSAEPLPETVKKQVSFKVLLPSAHSSSIDTASYNYQTDQNSLSYSANYAGSKVQFTQQPAPPSLTSDQPYYPAIGIHPYAQIKTKLGTVALTKFWESSSLKPQGQSAVLASNGTLLIAHADTTFTNEQWKSLFDSLKISK